MAPDCVETLLRQIDATKGSFDLYHFDIDRIDEHGNFESRKEDYPSVLSSYRFYRGKNAGRYFAFAVENVFSRRIYEQCGGFMRYDMAWGSDVATWILFSGEKGMCTVPHARVCWRQSSQNITPDMSRQVAKRKLRAEMEMLNWAYHYFDDKPDIYATNRAFFIYKIHLYRRFVSKECLKEAFAMFFATHGHFWERPLVYFFAFLIDGIYFRLRKRFSCLYGAAIK